MRKHITFTALLLVASLDAGFSQSPLPSLTPTPSTSATPSALPSASPLPSVCSSSSWSPESHTFYGKKSVIVEKLATLGNPSEHRLFVQITQGDSGGTVRLFERSQNSAYNVTEWSPQHTSELIIEIDKAIMANKGVNCVGEQIKSILKRLGNGKIIHDVPAPVSPEAAFAHPVKETRGEFIKTVIVYGC